MPVCVWCRQEKERSAFNAEHVLPQSFGTFEQNFTLIELVCEECNSRFSKELEPYLARDSLEGFDRYGYGLKSPSDFKSLGTRSTTRSEITEGQYAGALGYTIPGRESLGVTPFPQVGFASAEAGPFRWFMLDQLPSLEDLKRDGHGGSVHIRLCECDPKEATRLLADKGIHLTLTETLAPPTDRVWVEQVFRPQLPHRRALAKVALNYVAFQFGRDVALEPRFDAVRDLVLRGVEPSYPYYSIDEEALIDGDKEGGARAHGHAIVVVEHGDEVEAIVTLYNRLRHRLILANSPGTPLPPRGHFFDPSSRKILPLEPAFRILGVLDLTP